MHSQLNSICEELSKLTETQIKIQKDTVWIVADQFSPLAFGVSGSNPGAILFGEKLKQLQF